ncbi:TonB-dependent receptor [Acaryochloris marina NIES-2412]|uniref:TonB-dependent receptor n=1 Tax=Acaryochloris marina TaxID=155978 RepID=UPI004059AC2A
MKQIPWHGLGGMAGIVLLLQPVQAAEQGEIEALEIVPHTSNLSSSPSLPFPAAEFQQSPPKALLAVEPNTDIASTVQITGVELVPTETGLTVNLVGDTRAPSVPTVTTTDQTLTAILDNAVLALPEGNSVESTDPAPGIRQISVKEISDHQVQIQITGTTAPPTATVITTEPQLVLQVVSAETNAPENADGSEDEELEITVTAQRREEKPQDVPISLTVLTEPDIEDADITSFEDVAGNTPNFNWFSPTDSRSFSFYSVRGLSNFNFASRDSVGFFVDDVPLDYGGTLESDFPDLERVEILRGPQNTLYGRSAQAGVVNLITRKPTNDFEGNAALSFGSENNLNLRAGISGPLIEDELFFRLSGTFGRRDGFYDNLFLDGEEFDEKLGGNVRGKLLWTPSDRWEISFNAFYENNQDGTYPFVPLDDTPFEIEQDFNGFNTLRSNSQALKIVYRDDNVQATSISTRRFSELNTQTDLDQSTLEGGIFENDNDSTIFSQELRLQSPDDSESRWQWLIGGYFESRTFDENGRGVRLGNDAGLILPAPLNVPGARTDSVGELVDTTFAGFGQVSYRPIDALRLTVGLRYENVSSILNSLRQVLTLPGVPPIPLGNFDGTEQTSTALLPRFALDYQLSPNATVYGTVARGFRPGGVNIFADDATSLIFEPERSWNFEVGVKSNWLDNRLGLNLSLFTNSIEDYQVVTVDPITFNPVGIFNGNANVRGLELEMRATPVEGLDLTASLGLLDAEFTDFTDVATGTDFTGNRLPFSPSFTFNLAAQYRSSFGLFVRGELQGIGETFFDEANAQNIKQEAYVLANARLGYEFGRSGIFLFANNLFDTRYVTQAFNLGVDGSAAGSYGAPRTFGVQFRTRF